MPDLSGQSIGRYHIIEKLGEGGMAIVYKAFDSSLNCEVAFKIIRTEKIAPEIAPITLKRFKNEARKTASLGHPNIVSVIDYGEFDDIPYLVMKYIPGGTLKKVVGKPLHYKEAIKHILPIADALDYAHEKGIVHRDVKPANILITETGIPMLSDFGVAKILESSEETIDHLTMTGIGIGTPEYMSPEQAQGKKVDFRADIYSLGVVLYELLTGRKPFTADTPLAVIIKQTTDALPPPSLFVAGIPKQVEDVLLKAMAKKPEDRYSSMAEFSSQLQALLEGKLTDIQVARRTDTQKRKNFSENKPGSEEPTTKKIVNVWPILISLVVLGGLIFLLFVLKGKIPWFSLEPEFATVPSLTEQPLLETIDVTSIAEPEFDQSTWYSNPYAGPVPEGAVFRLGKGAIIDADLSPDGKTLVVATDLGLYLYDTDTLELYDYLTTDILVNKVVYAPAGGEFATANDDGSVTFWDPEENQTPLNIPISQKGINDIHFSNDGSYLIVASYDQTFRYIEPANGETIKVINISNRSPVLFDVNPEGDQFVCYFSDNLIGVFDVQSEEITKEFEFPDQTRVRRLNYSPDGKNFTVSDNYVVYTYGVESTDFLYSDRDSIDATNSPDLSTYVNLEGFGNLVITDIETSSNQIFQVPYGSSMSNDGVWKEFIFSPDSSKLFLVQTYGIGVITMGEKINIEWIKGFELYDNVFFQANSNNLITRSVLNTSDHNPPTLWDEAYSPIIFLDNPIQGVDVNGRQSAKIITQSESGDLIAGELSENDPSGWRFVYLWNLSDGTYIKRFHPDDELISDLSFSHSGKELTLIESDGKIMLYDLELGQTISQFNTSNNKAVFYPDDILIVTFGDITYSNSGLSIWSLPKFALVTTKIRPSPITSVAFSIDGETMITGEADGDIVTWNTSTWEMEQVLLEHDNAIIDLQVSHDGKILASSSTGEIRFWDMSNMDVLKVINLENGFTNISFSSDDRFLASFSANCRYCSITDYNGNFEISSSREYSNFGLSEFSSSAVIWEAPGK